MDCLDRVLVVGVVGLTMAVASSASKLPRPGSEPPAADVAVSKRVHRIEHGLVPPLRVAGEPVVPRSLTAAMAESGIPALALAIVDDCEVAWAGGWGTLEDGETGVAGSTPFQVGSVSKMVTAVVAMTMVVEGRLDLDQRVNELLTSWKLPDNKLTQEHPVLVRHLLSHSAGLTRTAYWLDRNQPMPELAAILGGETENPAIVVERVPGSRTIASNSGFLVLQSLLEDLSGVPLATLADKYVFTRLGMNSSAFEPVDQRFLDHAATNHRRDGSAMEGRAPLIPGAPGGLWSSAEDLARLVAELMKSWQGRPDGLLPRDLARQMLSPQIGDMALGIHLRGQGEGLSIQQAGGGIGSQARVIAFPELCRGAALVINTDAGRRVVAETLAAVGQEYDWPDLPVVVEKIRLPSSDLERFAGRYEYDAAPGSVMTFRVEGDTLVAQAGEGTPLPLTRASGSVFVWPGSASEMQFDPAVGGVIPGVTIGTAGFYGNHLSRLDAID